jgi:hypothetical protein
MRKNLRCYNWIRAFIDCGRFKRMALSDGSESEEDGEFSQREKQTFSMAGLVAVGVFILILAGGQSKARLLLIR